MDARSAVDQKMTEKDGDGESGGDGSADLDHRDVGDHDDDVDQVSVGWPLLRTRRQRVE